MSGNELPRFSATNDFYNDSIGDGLSKIDRYGWTIDGDQPEFAFVEKHKLKIDDSYQREPSEEKIARMSRHWRWACVPSLLVSQRSTHELFVYDGQHRLLAAMRRSDIDVLPCLISRFSDVQKEAQAFVYANVERWPMRSVDRYLALRIAQDRDTLAIDGVLEKCGLTLKKNPRNAADIGCVGALQEVFESGGAELLYDVVELSCELYRPDNEPIHAQCLKTLAYLHRQLACGLQDARFRQRVVATGPKVLHRAAVNRAKDEIRTSARNWAKGWLEVLNKTMRRNKFVLRQDS